MKKYLILGAMLFVTMVGISKEYQVVMNPDTECSPSVCDGGRDACCKTKGGTTFYGKCTC
ncbi:hypothetical protein B4N84_25115 [Flavobacterium sp. IR1]|nr:hypothetical protein B4N84_25115 [Flavobacterium sp. IR1]